MNRMIIAYKALEQLGFQAVALNGLYRLGLASGHYRRVSRGLDNGKAYPLKPIFPLPAAESLQAVLGQEGKAALLAEADLIATGKVRLFGGEAVDLRLTMPGRLEHWSEYETGRAALPFPEGCPRDVKYLWEPARFGWAFTLGRAYTLTGDERYAGVFWKNFQVFMDGNPPYLGPQWMSGQEAALRLMALAWAGQVFSGSRESTPERTAQLSSAIAVHAERIPPTLVYARSQQNNHLLSEAAGLLTAGLVLDGHPQAGHWRRLGWKALNRGLQVQVDGYGEYTQHSSNYQRLMLQLVLWCNAIAGNASLAWDQKSRQAVQRAVHWMLALLDPDSGEAPNLGANDGATIFPLSIQPFRDFRPVAHAAARAFLRYDLPPGPWDEMGLWFGLQHSGSGSLELPRYPGDQLYGSRSWAMLRTAQFNSRPSHADQLHLDLWWRGMNIARDAGTYLYNAPPPWDNRLTDARVHNTITVDGRDQFQRAGRFLYLDWADAYRQVLTPDAPGCLQKVSGHFKGRGYRQKRVVSVYETGRWLVEDEIAPRHGWQKRSHTYRLHWLLPDWEWELEERPGGAALRMKSPHGWLQLMVQLVMPGKPARLEHSLFRAGECLYGGSKAEEVRGWTAPTYGCKLPALSLALDATAAGTVQFQTEFILPQ